MDVFNAVVRRVYDAIDASGAIRAHVGTADNGNRIDVEVARGPDGSVDKPPIT